MRTSTRPRAHQASVAKQPYMRRVRRRHFQWDSRHSEEPSDCPTGRCCGEGEKGRCYDAVDTESLQAETSSVCQQSGPLAVSYGYNNDFTEPKASNEAQSQ